jgi:hypothetical protein
MAGDAHLGGHPHDTKTSARALHVVARPREASCGKRMKRKTQEAHFSFSKRAKKLATSNENKRAASRFALRRADSSSIDTPRDIRSTHRSRHTLHHYITII